jgi:predicted CXXCH cytochrome family protein
MLVKFTNPILGTMVKKPMVYYTEETPGVNRRLVAGYYLFLCLIGFAILLGPTGSGIPITVIDDSVRKAHESALPTYGDPFDPETCIGSCHQHDAEVAYWNETAHATVVTTNGTHVFIGTHVTRTWADFNATCAQCHATNWDNSTYPNTNDGIGVLCGACHDLTSPYYSIDVDNCGKCHLTSAPPHYFVDDWSNSAHANSLTDLRGSSHASSSCMHCMSGDGFIDPSATLDPADPSMNPLTCPACHSPHSADVVNPAQIRAVNSTELCGLCHSGSRYPMYDTFTEGPHGLTGIVECVSCHGYQPGAHGPTTNHTFYIVNATATCGQAPECHEGMEAWALSQLEEIQSSFDSLVSDFTTEADAFSTIVMDYNATAGADYELTSYVMGVVDDASSTVTYYQADSSSGFHDPTGTFNALNSAFRDLLDAEAYYYENLPAPTGGGGAPLDTLIIVGGAAGGIVVGLLLGVLVGRRR